MLNEYDEFDSFWCGMELELPGMLHLEPADDPAFAVVKLRRQGSKKQGIADQFYELQTAR